jgi:hypothetical protein
MGDGFIVLWAAHRLAEAERAGWLGRPVPALFGGPHVSHPSLMGHKVGAGDVVYPVCVSEGRLLVVCRVTVDAVMTTAEFAERRRSGAAARVPAEALPWLAPTCTDDVALARESTPLRADCAVPGAWLERIRLVNAKGQERALKHVAAGRLTHTAGISSHYYRLSAATRELLDRVVRGEVG